jgi:hypothetical protein
VIWVFLFLLLILIVEINNALLARHALNINIVPSNEIPDIDMTEVGTELSAANDNALLQCYLNGLMRILKRKILFLFSPNLRKKRESVKLKNSANKIPIRRSSRTTPSVYRDKEKQESSAPTTSGVQENPVLLKKDKKLK